MTLNPSVTLTFSAGGSFGVNTYTLISGASGLNDNSSSFNGWSVLKTGPFTGYYNYQFALSGNDVELNVTAGNGWIYDGSGLWSEAAKWNSGVPAEGTVANFGDVLSPSTTATVTVDANHTVSGMDFATTVGSSYVLTGASTLTLANSGNAVPITVEGGSHTINVAMTASDNVSVGIVSGAQLTISAPIGEVNPGTTLNVNGAGTLMLTAANLYSGVTTVNGGTLQLGDGVSNNGSVNGDIVVNSSLTFANPNPQTFSNNLSGAGSLVKTGAGVMTLSGTNITINGNVNVSSGTLRVVNTWTGGPGASPNTQYGFSAGPATAPNVLNTSAGGVLELYVDDSDPYQGDNDGGWGDNTFAGATGASPVSHASLGTQAGTIVTGNGVFLKTGPGVLAFETYNSSISFQMTGGTIDIEDGLVRNGSWGGGTGPTTRPR